MVSVTRREKPPANNFSVKPIALPGANGLVMLDYFPYVRTSKQL
jgi:hypothetical protein